MELLKTKLKMDKSVNEYMEKVFSQPESKRNLLDFKVGIISLIAGNLFSVFLFAALSREKFIVLSVVSMSILFGVAMSAQKAGTVTKKHYIVTFIITYIYGLVMFTTGDNSRGVIMFGLVYPVLSIYILKPLWGNILIAAEFATSLLADYYINPLKMNEETRSLFICIYVMFWLFGIVMEETRKYMEKRMTQQQEKLAFFADRDPLTTLLNRRSFSERVRELYPPEKKRSVCLLMMDIDNFKSINDTYGHNIGDEVLRETAERILKNSGTDINCRWGGEEFIILADIEDNNAAMAHAQKICDAIGKKPFSLSYGKELAVTVSVGAEYCACFSDSSLDALVKAADDNLYLAKQSGKNRVCAGIFH